VGGDHIGAKFLKPFGGGPQSSDGVFDLCASVGTRRGRVWFERLRLVRRVSAWALDVQRSREYGLWNIDGQYSRSHNSLSFRLTQGGIYSMN
jgi:hypothetical protein